MAAKRPPHSPGDSRVEAPPPAAPDRHTPSRMADEDSRAVAPPSSTRRKPVPPAATGLRAGSPKRAPSSPEKVDQARAETRERVQAARSERQQKVWDKLDAARRQATEKRERLRQFQPVRGGALGPDDEE